MTVYVLQEYDRHADTMVSTYSTIELAMSRGLVLMSTLDNGGTLGTCLCDGVVWYAYDGCHMISIHETTLIEE